MNAEPLKHFSSEVISVEQHHSSLTRILQTEILRVKKIVSSVKQLLKSLDNQLETIRSLSIRMSLEHWQFDARLALRVGIAFWFKNVLLQDASGLFFLEGKKSNVLGMTR